MKLTAKVIGKITERNAEGKYVFTSAKLGCKYKVTYNQIVHIRAKFKKQKPNTFTLNVDDISFDIKDKVLAYRNQLVEEAITKLKANLF